MESVRCSSCDNRVLVEKYSEAHSSIQWLEDADDACPEFACTRAGNGRSWVPTCPRLQETIDELIVTGQIGMSPRSYPIPGRLE